MNSPLDMLPPAELDIIVPELGAGTLRVRVCSWLAALGETVHEGDRLVELSLPGMTFDISSPGDGTLVSIDKPIGTEVHAGDQLGKLQAIDEESP